MTVDGGTRTHWPLPNEVGAYGDRDAFNRCRQESGQWVFWPDRVDLVLQGRYDDVKPLHVELSPTYLCNFACPWCSCRSAREDWSDADVFNHPRATPLTVMRGSKLDRVIEHLAAHQIGIMWVGGEPTMNQLLYPTALKARDAGLAQCLFTNGSLLSPDRSRALFDAELVFVRVSLNAVTEQVHAIHHDYDPRRGYSDKVLANLAELARLRSEQQSPTQLGVSIVVDERNVGDLEPTVRHLVRLCEDYGTAAVDYAMFRPAFPFYTAQLAFTDDTARRFAQMMAPDAPLHRALVEHGVRVVIPESSIDRPAPPPLDDLGCLAAGWFGEVTPNGDLVACSDRYGNPDYFVGNLAERPLDELWNGAERRQVLELARKGACYQTHCPSNGRGYYFNGIFRQVERMRAEGRLDDVVAWIKDLRQVLPTPTHSFFL